jgi:4-amino-4-deoxy-L-arabinose transferase-like glycosyltransferase
MGKTEFSGQEVKTIILIFLACLFLFFYKLGDRPLWEYDEAKHAQIAKEMLIRGDWITPTFNGEPFYDKPILHFWLVMLSYLIFGVNEFSARFPSALLGMGGVFLVYVWARSLYGRISGVLSSLVLATSIEYIILSQNIVHDMSLCFFITLSLFLFHKAYREDGFTKISFILFFSSLGLAVLAKGPIGVALPGLIIFPFFLITRKWGLILNRRTFWGILVFSIVALPWYLAMASKNPDFIQSFFIQENFSRFLSRNPNHQERVYFFLPVLFIGSFLWSTFLPSALLHHIKQYRRGRSRDTLFLLLATIVPFLFFSLSSTKLATYILPVFPFLSILIGTFFAHGLSPGVEWSWKQHFRYSCIAFFFIITIGLLLGIIYLSKSYPLYLSNQSFLLVAVLLAGGMLCFYFGWKGRVFALYGTIVAMIVVTIFFSVNFILPTVSHFKSAKELSKTVKNLLPPGETIIFYEDLRESFIFYTDHPGKKIEKKEQLESYLDSPERVYCIIKDSYYEKLKALLKDKMYLIDREGYFLLISNKPPNNI